MSSDHKERHLIIRFFAEIFRLIFILVQLIITGTWDVIKFVVSMLFKLIKLIFKGVAGVFKFFWEIIKSVCRCQKNKPESPRDSIV